MKLAMHVFFDEQAFVAQQEGGISRYFTELARELGRAGLETSVFGGITRNLYLPGLRGAEQVTTCYRPRRDHWRINTWVARVSRVWRRWTFARARRHWQGVLYHATGYEVDPWIAGRAQATCVTVFDMIAELLCDEATRRRSLSLKRSGIARAHGIFCISEQTRRDFLSFFPERESSVRVTPLSASLAEPTAAMKEAAAQHAPYLLMVGKRHGYKNGITGLRAFAQLANADPQLKLVCFGGERLAADEEADLAGGIRRRVVMVSGDDALLAGFYTEAAALLYPSRYEGFGLPVLEAMHLGCPVVTTRCASLPEVAGTAACYAAPDEPGAFADAARRILQDEACRQEWIRAGRAQARGFSWARTAAETRSFYEQLLARSSQFDVQSR